MELVVIVRLALVQSTVSAARVAVLTCRVNDAIRSNSCDEIDGHPHT